VRASEELRLSPPPNGEGEVAWYRIRVRPLEGVARDGLMAWTVSDETRDHARHETFFQDLQHAIDYLDHAPAGFFSAEPDGSIAHMNATLAGWLDHDLAQFGVGRLKIDDIVAGDGGAMLAMMSGPPGEVTTQQFDVDLKPRQGRLLPARILHKVAFSGDGTPGPSRSLVINRAPGEIKGEDLRAAEVDFLTIGQYLQPSRKHHPVVRFVPPDEFKALATIAYAKGFSMVSASPLTRSSHHAGEDFARLKALRTAR